MTRQTVRPELVRARTVTGFTELLSRFLKRHRALHCVSLVDGEGECVDDATRLSGDVSALVAATWTVLRPVFEQHGGCLGGAVYFWTVDTAEHAYAIRRVGPELAVVLAGSVGAMDRRVVDDLHALAEQLRFEANIAPEPGDFWGRTVRVEVRASRRWGYAPRSYAERDVDMGPLEVLGRFSEVWAGVTRVCFVARAATGDLTLCHDTEQNRWFIR